MHTQGLAISSIFVSRHSSNRTQTLSPSPILFYRLIAWFDWSWWDLPRTFWRTIPILDHHLELPDNTTKTTWIAFRDLQENSANGKHHTCDAFLTVVSTTRSIINIILATKYSRIFSCSTRRSVTLRKKFGADTDARSTPEIVNCKMRKRAQHIPLNGVRLCLRVCKKMARSSSEKFWIEILPLARSRYSL